MKGAAPTEEGQRLRDMVQVLKARAPRLRPNIVPLAFKNVDIMGLCSTEEQRAAAMAVMEARRKAASRQFEEPQLAIVTDVDLDAGVFRVVGAKYVSEVEADLYSVPTILNLHCRGEHEELSIRVQHFLSVNGLDAADALAAQELYSLAFAIGVCLSAAPLKGMVAGRAFPLEEGVDAGKVVEGLFDFEASQGAGAADATAGKRPKKKAKK